MKKNIALAIGLYVLSFFSDVSYATMITTEIYLKTLIRDDLGIDLSLGDAIGTFLFDDATPVIDRDASDYGGMPEGIPTDTEINYDPFLNQYNGSLEAYWDREYYDISFSGSKLPFQFNVELDTVVMTFNIEGIFFDTNTNILFLDHSRLILGDGLLGSMSRNVVVMGYDLECYVFEYGIRFPPISPPQPIPEPVSKTLLLSGLIVFSFKQYWNTLLPKLRNICAVNHS